MLYRLASWNVNGIRSCASKGLLNWINHSRRQIFCLQETRAMPEQIVQLHPQLVRSEKFHIQYACADKKGHSGVAILGHRQLSQPAFSTGLGKKEFDCEGRTVIAEYPHFILINCYFPNGRRDHSRVPYKLAYSKAVVAKARALEKKTGKGVIICGDVNTAHREIDLANPKQNQNTTGFLPIEREWMDHILRSEWIDVYRHLNGDKLGEYTWWTYRNNCRQKNIGWRIDYFLASKSLLQNLKQCSHRPDIIGSDHCPVYCDLDFPD